MNQMKQRLNKLINQLTLEEKISLLSTSQSEIKRLKIPAYEVGGEAAHGVVDREGGKTTSFPLPLGLSQTWNPDLLKVIGDAIGKEARIKYLQSEKKSWLTLWAPTIDMERDPRWGRNEEAYGEDPFLTGRLSVGMIKGMQGADSTWIQLAAAPKHFYGNNNEYLRESTSNSIDPRNREEYYLKAFEPAFRIAKAQSMMTAYNGINGTPGMQLNEIEDIVRKRWGMDGFVVSDGGALSLNVDDYHYYDNYEEALADALKKGIDCFVDDKELVEKTAFKALEENLITEDDITRAIKRTLNVRMRLGHFEEAILYDEVDHSLLAGEKYAKLAYEATVEQTVILKNEDLLPLNQNQKIFLTGPLSDVFLRDWYGGTPPYQVTIKNGLENTLGSEQLSYISPFKEGHIKVANQYIGINKDILYVTTDKEKAEVFIMEDWDFDSYLLKHKKSKRYVVLDEEKNIYKLNKKEVYDWFVKEVFLTEDKLNWNSWNGKPINIVQKNKIGVANDHEKITFEQINQPIEDGKTLAKDADVCVIVLGNHPMINGKETIDRPGMRLPNSQLQLVKELYQVNKNLLVIIVGSYPFEIEWLKNNIPAILFTSHGSQELGNAMTDIMYHRHSPSGKLSQTWYLDVGEALSPITDYDIIQGERTYRYSDSRNILYSFGHGLTYGQLEIISAKINKNCWKQNEEITTTITVQNHSNFSVTETVQCYSTLSPKQKIKLPKKQLVGFSKEIFRPNEIKEIKMQINTNELSFWDVAEDDWLFPKAFGLLRIGFSSEDIKVALSFKTEGTVRKNRSFYKGVHGERFDGYSKVIITEDINKEKIVSIEKDGYIYFKQVQKTYKESKLKIIYNAKYEGFLNVFGDKKQEKILAKVYFEKGIDNEISFGFPQNELTDMYFIPTENIQIKTIQEVELHI